MNQKKEPNSRTPARRVLVATRDAEAVAVVREAFGPDSLIEAVQTPEAFQERAAAQDFDLLLVDIDFFETAPGKKADDYRKDLQKYWGKNPQTEIIVLTRQERIRETVSLVKAGAGNYLTYPLSKDEVRYVLESLYESLKVQQELDYFRDEHRVRDTSRIALLASPVMQIVYEKVKLVAPTKSIVLLVGETGTGKGVIARLIHSLSIRPEGPFISVHCGALPEELVQSELFGHEKGSFTGAVRRRLGKFELAAGGTIFLDEIGTISPSTQIKLLQVLQEKIFQRVGGETDIPTDARIIAATNSDLKKLSDAGAFRTDLYYRLNVFPIEIPPLRERKEDIAPLCEHFLERLNAMHLKEIHGFHPLVLEAFYHYDWPGNVRELENLIERAFILETSHVLTPESFPAELVQSMDPGGAASLDISQPLADIRRRTVEFVERAYLRELLAEHGGRIKSSAAHAGVTPRQLHNLLTKYEIRKEDFK